MDAGYRCHLAPAEFDQVNVRACAWGRACVLELRRFEISETLYSTAPYGSCAIIEDTFHWSKIIHEALSSRMS
jgi:hypothetical protein